MNLNKRVLIGIEITGCLVILLATLVAILFAEPTKHQQQVVTSRPLPSLQDIQQRLKDMGYDVKVDGVYGDKTKAAWENAVCLQEGTQYFGPDAPKFNEKAIQLMAKVRTRK